MKLWPVLLLLLIPGSALADAASEARERLEREQALVQSAMETIVYQRNAFGAMHEAAQARIDHLEKENARLRSECVIPTPSPDAR